MDFEFQQAKPEVSKDKLEKQENQADVPKRPKMHLLGMDGNVFVILGAASRMLLQEGMDEQANEMIARVQKSENYYQALHIISEYVETELSARCRNAEKTFAAFGMYSEKCSAKPECGESDTGAVSFQGR